MGVNTKLKKSEQPESFIDYDKLKKEIKRLRTESGNLSKQIGVQAKELSDLTTKVIEINKEHDKIIADAKEEAKVIVERAKVKERAATKKEAEATGKIANAEKREKEANDLIKSNEGKEKNLKKSKEENDDIKEKLLEVLELIKNVL